MENVFTTLTAGEVTPVPQEYCRADNCCGPFSTVVARPEDLQVVDLIRMVSVMHYSIARPNKTNPAEYHFYCGIMD